MFTKHWLYTVEKITRPHHWMRFTKQHILSCFSRTDMRHDYQNTHQVNTSKIQTLHMILDRIKVGWPMFHQLHQCSGRYVGNFAEPLYRVWWTMKRDLSDRISVFLMGNWAPGLQTDIRRKGAGCQKTWTAKRQEGNTGQRQVVLWRYVGLNVRQGQVSESLKACLGCV